MNESVNSEKKDISIPLRDEDATIAFGSSLSKSLTPGQIVFLEGNLGAGKTTCVRGILRGFGFSAAVKSPTYTLVEEYEFPWGIIYHFDLYRIKEPAELEFIGFREYFTENAIVLVEWAERGLGALPKPDLELIFSIQQNAKNTKNAQNDQNDQNAQNPLDTQDVKNYQNIDDNKTQRIVTVKWRSL